MQGELDAEGLPIPVHLLGVNYPGLESGNAAICNGRDIPWLQDTAADSVWVKWGAEWRDVILLNGKNEPVGVYNLTSHNLADAGYYAELKDMLRALATPSGAR